MGKAPAFQWYPKDCDTDENVRCMDDAEFGFYVRCLNHAWLNNGLPESLEDIARIMGHTHGKIKKYWNRVGRCFVLSDGRHKNSKQEGQRVTAREFRDEVSAHGVDGASAKWGIPVNKQGALTRSQRLTDARGRGTHTTVEWAELQVLCGHRCVKCGNFEKIVKDHILPIYREGSDSIENIQPLCDYCNSSKGSESIDYRPEGTLKCLRERLQNACKTPAVKPGSPSASPSPTAYNSNVYPPNPPAPDGASAQEPATAEPPKVQSKKDLIGDWFYRDFWPVYPRKDDKEKALKAARKSLPGSKPSEVMTGLRRQLPEFNQRERHNIPLPSTWLNGKRWKDELGTAGNGPLVSVKPRRNSDVLDEAIATAKQREGIS